MPFILRTLIAFSLLLTTALTYGQYTYKIADTIKVSEANYQLKNPWAGGFNAPQFGEIDLNGDGKMDLIVFDRSGNRVTPFINRGSTGISAYEYAPQYTSIIKGANQYLHFADFNCDGLMDYITCFTGSSPIVYTNIGSTGNNRFDDGTRLWRDPPFDKNDVSMKQIDTHGVKDIDGDGDIDILTMGNSQVFYYKNVSIDSTGLCGLRFNLRNICWGEFFEGNIDSKITIDSCVNKNVGITDPESNDGEDGKGEPNNYNKHAGSTIALFDFDNKDGMDMLLGDVSGDIVKRLMNKDLTSNYKSSKINSVDSIYPPASGRQNKVTTFISPFIQDFNNDGLEDLILTTNNLTDPIAADNKHIKYFENTGSVGNPNFTFIKNDFLLEDILDFGSKTAPGFFDYNSDGLIDILVGNERNVEDTIRQSGRLALLENIGTPTSPRYKVVDRNYLQIDTLKLDQIASGPTYSLTPSFPDIDNDGDVDLLLGDTNGRLHLFENTAGPGNTASFTLKEAFFQGISVGVNSSPSFADLDRDGKTDLIVGEEVANLNFFKNRGTNEDPIYNLKVDSIRWVGNFIFDYYINGNPDLSNITLNKRYEITQTQVAANKGFLELIGVNDTENYLSFRNYIIDSDTINENNSGYIDISFDSLGKALAIPSYNRPSTSSGKSQGVFYEYQNQWQLLTGTLSGEIMAFTDIDSNLYGQFTLAQNNILDIANGNNIHIDAKDINNDGKPDLVVGNRSGGIAIYYGSGFVGIDDLANSKTDDRLGIEVFPNPTEGIVTVNLPWFKEGTTYEIEVYNITGKLVSTNRESKARTSVNLRTLPKGVYFVKVRTQTEQTKASKLIIQ